MKFILCGDIHYRATTPRARVDNYHQTLLGKIDQINSIAEKYNCSVILQPGDFFDSSTPPLHLLVEAIEKHKEHKWMVVMGNHDQRYHHNSIENTPLGVLEAAGVVDVLYDERTAIRNGDGFIHLYGCSWSEDIPKPVESDNIRILVMHRMVIGSEKLWAEQEEFMWARNVLRRHKFDLIVTGDNHQFFTDTLPGRHGPRHIVNCGSLMRANSDQGDHKPAVVVYDTEDRSIEIVPLKVAPAKKVLSSEVAERAKAQNAELEAFVDQIGDTTIAPELDFLSNLNKLTKKAPKGVAAKVQEIVKMSE